MNLEDFAAFSMRTHATNVLFIREMSKFPAYNIKFVQTRNMRVAFFVYEVKGSTELSK